MERWARFDASDISLKLEIVADGLCCFEDVGDGVNVVVKELKSWQFDWLAKSKIEEKGIVGCEK